MVAMRHTEHALAFQCEGDELIGIVSVPDGADQAPETGLLIVVGGPQYRVGSHRLFVSLARLAARQGLAAMRFDHRGMGDGLGTTHTFESIVPELHAAIDALQQQVPTINKVVLWGLCDGASASCFYADLDPRVAGLILVNPWVHTQEGAAITHLRHYYRQRLLSRGLWMKLLSGKLPRILPATRLAASVVRSRLMSLLQPRSARGSAAEHAHPLPLRMGHQLLHSGRPVAVALSDDDKVAREFEDQAWPTPTWQQVRDKQLLELVHLTQADHTVTSEEAAKRLCELSVSWAQQMAAKHSPTER